MMANEALYNVIITGELLPGFELKAVQEAFSKLVKIPQEQAVTLIDKRKQRALKRNLPITEANRYKSDLENIGLVTIIESAPDSHTGVFSLSHEPEKGTSVSSTADSQPDLSLTQADNVDPPKDLQTHSEEPSGDNNTEDHLHTPQTIPSEQNPSLSQLLANKRGLGYLIFGAGNFALYIFFNLYLGAFEKPNIIHYVFGVVFITIFLIVKFLMKAHYREDLYMSCLALFLCFISIFNNINILVSSEYQGEYKIISSTKTEHNEERLVVQLDNGKKFKAIVDRGRRDFNFRKGLFGVYFAK